MSNLQENTIKLDLDDKRTYPYAFNRSLDRITKKNQSLVVNEGYREFPKFLLWETIAKGKKLPSAVVLSLEWNTDST